MVSNFRGRSFAISLALLACGLVAAGGTRAARAEIGLAPHTAVYDLKLKRSTGSRSLADVRGRILYDFTGSACEGWTLNFRQVSELSSSESGSALSDLRSLTWEDAKGKRFRFSSDNKLNDKVSEKTEGEAVRGPASVKVTLSKPERGMVAVPADVAFPTEHMRRIIEAARSDKTILEMPVYDGSDTGMKVYHTLTVIGRRIGPGEKPPADAAGGIAALGKVARWPVTISYFEKQSADAPHSGEQTPVYSIAFELYENGISRALTLDYTDFVLSGELTSLDLKAANPCK